MLAPQGDVQSSALVLIAVILVAVVITACVCVLAHPPSDTKTHKHTHTTRQRTMLYHVCVFVGRRHHHARAENLLHDLLLVLDNVALQQLGWLCLHMVLCYSVIATRARSGV